MIAIQTPIAKQDLANLPVNATATAVPVAPKAKYPFPYNAGIFSVAAKRFKAADQGKNV